MNPLKQGGADFTGMSDTDDPTQQLYIAEAFHKAFIEVNEKGTEAAAATALPMPMAGALPQDMPFTPTFRADRPFLYLLRDRESGAVLFIGRMMNPTDK